MRSRRRAERAAGFTLIEVLVAFAIAAVLLVPLIRIFSGGIGGLARSERAATASIWAETVLAARDGETPLSEGVEGGDLPGGYRWQRTVALYREGGFAQEGRPLVPYEVTVTLSWREGVRVRSVTLETLRLARPPQS